MTIESFFEFFPFDKLRTTSEPSVRSFDLAQDGVCGKIESV